MTRPCLCEDCAVLPAPTYTEQYRHECEVRVVIALPHKGARKIYLRDVARFRGAAARSRIIEDMPRIAREVEK